MSELNLYMLKEAREARNKVRYAPHYFNMKDPAKPDKPVAPRQIEVPAFLRFLGIAIGFIVLSIPVLLVSSILGSYTIGSGILSVDGFTLTCILLWVLAK